jgi:phosphoglycolate phosphatase-like HAD superfamily hydrolase
MRLAFKAYKIVIFDSDGVILNSNSIKLRSFMELAASVGSLEDAENIATIITNSKALTRYEIVAIIQNFSTQNRDGNKSFYYDLLNRFSNLTYSSLLNCDLDAGIYMLKHQSPRSQWFVLTAGDQQETESLYRERGIINLFSGGIYGAPISKQTNLERILAVSKALDPDEILMLGDSYSDAELAFASKIDFALINHWSHCSKAEDFCRQHSQSIFRDLVDVSEATSDGCQSLR